MSNAGSTDGLGLSERARAVRASPAFALMARAQALAAQGRPVLAFGAGEPDFPPPDHVRRATARALAQGLTRYTPAAGLPALRDEIARQASGRTGAGVAAEQVVVTPGAKMALYALFQATCGPGDEVVLLTPCWPSYVDLVTLAGARPVLVPTRAQDAYRPDPERLRAALSPRTRLVVLNSPGNPTGACYGRATLEGLAATLEPTRALVVSDEIYGRLTFAGVEAPSVAALSRAWAARTVVVDGVSKAYAMTGFRVGWAVGPAPVVAAMTRLQEQTVSCAAAFAQAGALAALQGPQESVGEMVRELERRRDLVVAGLAGIDGVACRAPEGAFYALPDVTGLLGRRAGGRVLSSDAELCEWLLEAHGLALLPGGPFGAPGHVRWSFAASPDELRRGLARLRHAVAELE